MLSIKDPLKDGDEARLLEELREYAAGRPEPEGSLDEAAPGPGDEGPLSGAEAGLLARLLAQMERRAGIEAEAQINLYYLGLYLYYARRTGLWRRDPRFAGQSFIAFARAMTGKKSRHPIERLMIVARGFTLERYQELVAAGLCLSALVLLARCPARLLPGLERLARDGASVHELQQALSEGQAKLAEISAWQDKSEAEIEAELGLAMAEGRMKAAREARASKEKEAERRRHDRSEGTEELQAELVSLRRSLALAEERLKEAELHAQQVARREAELVAKEALLREAEARGGTVSEAVAARHEELARAQVEMEVQRAALEAKAQALAEREQALVCGEQIAQQNQQEAARLSSLRQAMEAEQAALEAGRAELAQALQGQQDFETWLFTEKDRLTDLSSRLEAERTRIIEAHRALAAGEIDLSEREYRYARWVKERQGLVWPVTPLSLDGIVGCMQDTLERVVGLTVQARRFIDKGHVAGGAGLGGLVDLKKALGGARGALGPLLIEMGEGYQRVYPERAEEFFRRREAGLAQETAVLDPALVRPVARFELPTVALLGTNELRTAQQGVLGTNRDGTGLITVDMDDPQAVVLIGQPGMGKSNGVAVYLENGQKAKKNICDTREPYLQVVAHWSEDPRSPAPRWSNYFKPNDEEQGLKSLGMLSAKPQPFDSRRKIVYVPPLDDELLEERKREYAGMEVRVLNVAPSDLDMELLKGLMGTHKKAPLYMARISYGVERLPKDQRTAQGFIKMVKEMRFGAQVQEIVDARLQLLERLLGSEPLAEQVGVGDFVGLDMRAPYLDREQAMALFVLATRAFSAKKEKVKQKDGSVVEVPCLKMLIYDEAHKYLGTGLLSQEIARMVREMRHRRCFIVIASQDPESLDTMLLSLSTMQVVFSVKSKKSMKLMAELCAGWEKVTVEEMAQLPAGVAKVMATQCAAAQFRLGPQEIRVRASCAKPSGTTISAVRR